MADESGARANRVQQVTGRLMRRMRAQTEGSGGLSITQDWALALLIQSPMSSAELARVQGVRAQTMSTAIAGLERAGCVRREADPDDGRRMVLHATDAGIEAYESSRARKLRWLQRSLADLSPDELRALDRGLELLERIADR
jgi:DNA-binding MarR family transcriptional regulator